MDTGGVLARFEAERQALALMDHPHIAKVLDAGTTSGVRSQGSGVSKQGDGEGLLTPDSCLLTPDSGRPFFVMELVKGVPLTAYCDQHRLSVGDRLGLFRQVCFRAGRGALPEPRAGGGWPADSGVQGAEVRQAEQAAGDGGVAGVTGAAGGDGGDDIRVDPRRTATEGGGAGAGRGSGATAAGRGAQKN
jgi:hypothetical protein